MHLSNAIPPINIELNDWHIVKSILQQQILDYEVWVFGSRARGNPKKFSDLDIVIQTKEPLSIAMLAKLQQAFSDSDLPFKVDIVDGASISEAFKKIINDHYVIIQTTRN